MPIPPLSSTSPSSWIYTAEGGANLVLSFSGTPDSPFVGRALRLRKRKRPSRELRQGDEVHGESGVEFGRSVVERLLGREQLPEMETVELEREWVEELAQRLREEKVRPPEREKEDEVDVEAGEAVVVEDLVGGTGVLAVEIKPKWGFLPSPSRLSPSTSTLKTSFCRFCMHRYHKRALGHSSSPASDDAAAALLEHDEGYCPLDQYSSDPERVRSALEKLYVGWIASNGEGNSLRVFLNGERLSPANPLHVGHLALTLQHLALTLQHLALSSSVSPSRPPEYLASASFPLSSLFSAVLLPALASSPLLSTLKHLQRTLDALDIEGLAALLLEREGLDLFSPDADLSKLGEQPTLPEWESWLARYLPILRPSPSASPSTSPSDARDTFATVLAYPPTSTRDAVLAYLISATFKDCSLILRLPLPTSAGVHAQASVKPIDLDPKPLARMGKYARMDAEILASWAGLLDGIEAEERAKVRRCRQ
ncbi:hypothetical protein JCM10213_002409 [Rhodosporidiobolus nylandii]